MMRARGFTLIELLVAMAIFAIISVLAMGGLNTFITQQTLAQQNLQQLAELQRTVRMLTWDFAQLYPRPVRDELGSSTQAALVAADNNDYFLRLTRGGWRNPAGLKRGTLQRVQYRLEERQLIREYWPVVDAPLGMEPRSEVLIAGVEDLLIEYLDAEDQWNQQWPPLRLLGAQNVPQPRAARITLQLDGWGEIERLVEMTP